MGTFGEIAAATAAAAFAASADLVLVGDYSRPSVGLIASGVEFIPQPIAPEEMGSGYLQPGDVRLIVRAATLGGHAFKMDGGDTLTASLSGGGTAQYLVIGGALDAAGAVWRVYGRAT